MAIKKTIVSSYAAKQGFSIPNNTDNAVVIQDVFLRIGTPNRISKEAKKNNYYRHWQHS